MGSTRLLPSLERFVIAMLAVVLCFNCPANASTQDVSLHGQTSGVVNGQALPTATSVNNEKWSEAAAFFANVIQQSDNPVIAAMARESLKKLQVTHNVTALFESAPAIRVPLIRQGNTSLGVLTTLNNQVQGTFIIDTGATYTVITPSVAKKLHAHITEHTDSVALQTANGIVEAPIVIIPSVKIAGFEVKNVPAIVQPLGDSPSMFGLLGLNFFKGLNFSFTENSLILEVQPTVGLDTNVPENTIGF
jgi:clan AA aspartic protease (TIGR02281 family)